jgi:hypothetical protein
MPPSSSPFHSRFFLLLVALLAAHAGRAQTLLVELTFDASNFAQTGAAGTTFGIAQGSVTFETGAGGGLAAVFDGETSLQASDSPVTSGLTLSFWMKTTTDNAISGSQWYEGAGLVDGELGGDTTDWGISQMGTQLAFGIGYADTTIFSASNVNTGNWIHVAATWDTSGTMSLYLNGNLEATDIFASTEPRDTFNQFFIGQDLGGGTYTGSLDEIRIYDSALSGGQIAALAAIPEPATYAWIFGAGACLAVAFKRRRVGA